MRNLPKVFTRQRPGRESNRVSVIRKSDALPVSHRATKAEINPSQVTVNNWIEKIFQRELQINSEKFKLIKKRHLERLLQRRNPYTLSDWAGDRPSGCDKL